MIHARADYNRIQDPALKDRSILFKVGGTPIAEDEPVFLIRGQDLCAVEALSAYANIAEAKHASPELVRTVREHAARIQTWQMENRAKVPDL